MPGRSSGATSPAAPLVPLGSAAAVALIVLKMVWVLRPEAASALRALAPREKAVNLTVQDAMVTALEMRIIVLERSCNCRV